MPNNENVLPAEKVPAQADIAMVVIAAVLLHLSACASVPVLALLPRTSDALCLSVAEKSIMFTTIWELPVMSNLATVIRNNHSIDVTGEHIVTLGLNSLDVAFFLTLDDATFGRLDEGSLL